MAFFCAKNTRKFSLSWKSCWLCAIIHRYKKQHFLNYVSLMLLVLLLWSFNLYTIISNLLYSNFNWSRKNVKHSSKGTIFHRPLTHINSHIKLVLARVLRVNELTPTTISIPHHLRSWSIHYNCLVFVVPKVAGHCR